MKVIPTAAVLGAEIAGVDLSRHLDDATFAAIERAYDEYGVIFFRGQSITPAQQVAHCPPRRSTRCSPAAPSASTA